MALSAMELAGRSRLLKKSSFFSDFDDADLRELAKIFVSRKFYRGEYIWFEGDVSDSFAVIRDGYVKIVKHSREGKDVLVEFLGPGEAMGIVALVEGRPFPASACAFSTVTLLLLSRNEYLEAMSHNPMIAKQSLVTVGSRLKHAHEMMRRLAVEPVESRIASVLLTIVNSAAVVSEGKAVLTVRLTRADIAEMAGSAPETAIRILSRWQKAGLIDKEKGRMVVPDVAALRQISFSENSSL